MNIVYTLNNNFVSQVSASMASICENNKEVKLINFYLISHGIANKNKKLLKQFIKKYKRNIEIIELDEISNYFDFEFDTSGWNSIVLARLIMDNILPINLDRVLYLDGDTIVRGKLDSLWNLDLKDKILGMCVEPTVDRERLKDIGLYNYPYYNAGVLLIDLNKWRQEKVGKKVLDYYRKYNGRLFANDQDAINGALKNLIMPISIKYNFCNSFYIYPYSFLKKLMKGMAFISKNDFNQCVRNPIIIHYLGEERPWRKGNAHKYRNDYLFYLSLTPYANIQFESGWELYFICWRIFNFLMKPFPALRYKIIVKLIPLFLKHRKKKLNKVR